MANFPGCPSMGSPVVREGILEEERSGTSAPLLQRGWLLAALSGNPDSWHAGGLTCHWGMLSYTGNWKLHSGTAPSAQPCAHGLYTLVTLEVQGTIPICSHLTFFLTVGENAYLRCFILAVLLFAQGWFPSTYPCD